jgi:hypothetical protein
MLGPGAFKREGEAREMTGKTQTKAEIAERVRAAGVRALAEAEARRRDAADGEARPKEIGGPKGPEPTRYGDWERNGIVSDF